MSQVLSVGSSYDSSAHSRRTATRAPKTAEIVARAVRRRVVDGDLKDGDFLPTEAELMSQFAVSRSTVREALLLLESDGLVVVRRGARSGGRIRMPGPESVARPAGLLLQASAATIADVMTALSGIEAVAARSLADQGSHDAVRELESILENEFPRAFSSGSLPAAAGLFHGRLVELTGNAALTVIAGMLHQIAGQHIADALRRRRTISKSDYAELGRSYARVLDLLRLGDGDAAEAHWRRHADTTRQLLLRGTATVKVRDIID